MCVLAGNGYLAAQDAIDFWSDNSLSENTLLVEKKRADSLISLVSENYFNQGSYAAGIVQELYKIAYRTKDADLFVQCCTGMPWWNIRSITTRTCWLTESIR